ncbi:glycosyltransferase [Stenotrophomonas mori]|uniref:Glycosyltransferase n=1 Tax=Stenotrophomonas mori TaxID=2871096 RepID=A0ABT0SHZ9_9GAMM|nr:glycosyltransferase [Stenotrophomonas mori]MCL7714941.1 glycosyltransferase [Stenotrophomonas mori]
MNTIVDAVLARRKAVTPRQLLVVAVTFSLLLLGSVAAAAGRYALTAIALLALQAVAVMVVLLSQRRISQRLSEGLRGPGAQQARRGKGRSLRRFSAARYYAKANADKCVELVGQLVLDRSLDGRDILAYRATRGELDVAGIRSLLESFRMPGKRGRVVEAARAFDKSALLGLARTLYRQDAGGGDRLDAISLYQLALALFGRSALETSDFEWLASLLIQERRLEEALGWLSDPVLSPAVSANHYFLRANALNPFVDQTPGLSIRPWLDALNAGYGEWQLAAVEMADAAGNAFSRLAAGVQAASVDGPLVSVIMPVYCAGAHTDVAIRSVLAQTWKNLELIIVDDGSPAEHQAVLTHWAQADERIRLIRCPQNRGAYVARNAGLDAARGEFVTCHDADDWSHPMRIKRQASDLARNSGRIANLVNLVRVDVNLEVRHRHPGRTLQHVALSSLMFRRAEVLARVGYWDAVRKMGDAEFIHRIALAFEQKIESILPPPLLFALQDVGSLSGSDMCRGFMHPERQLYRTRYREWHERIAAGEASAYLPASPETRPFPAPMSFLPHRGGREQFDVLFVSELGFTGGNVHSLIHEMEICVAAGLKVGLVHVHNLLFTHLARREPIDALTALVVSGKVTQIAMTTPADASLVIVRWPACFQYTSSLPSGIRGLQTVVVANHPPYERHQDRHSYEMGQVSRNVAEAFGPAPRWAPQSATIRRMLEPQLPGGALLDVDWIAVLAKAPVRTHRREVPVAALPVIGRHSRDHHLKWPEDRETLLKVYPSDGTCKVRVLGGVDHVIASGALRAEDIEGWEVHGFGTLQPLDFLRSIDFFVYFHHKDWVEAFGRVIMEAMFAGAVVVLPPTFEPVFGEAALYAEPDGVQALIQAYYRDWPRFQEQSERALAYAHDNCTPAAYRRRLARLGVQALSADLDAEAA